MLLLGFGMRAFRKEGVESRGPIHYLGSLDTATSGRAPSASERRSPLSLAKYNEETRTSISHKACTLWL